ncbi:hypothetical protein G647_09816 [Cladophialophora carrionii CBS 160.54]|uniref:Uncharacterized protein n=1 Tax=Cladophialophora carrionii CBS 160.54 TaxID=1279043 RepID=V9DJQ7_9EURO|nr:uncharacterized protein G647_09816 [Cladophialophora carrionii CBS 160.54]ETI27134.1 hypothetical protein G647_09816 [Cladophialophora carrionii CBS 160.54]
MPEHSYTSSRGIPEGGPLAAAAAAFHKDRDYSTSNLPGAFPKEPAYDSVTIPPSSSTSTANPPSRSATYGQTEDTKVPDANAAAQSATSAASVTREPGSDEPRHTSTVGKILGAVGLGTAAAGAGVASSRARDDVSQPTTTTGVDSYTAPTRSVPVSSDPELSEPAHRHQRKESIPTTAYPAGLESPAPINAPIGGTSASREPEYKDHTGRNAAFAAAGVGAHEYGRDKELRQDVMDTPAQGTANTAAPAAIPQEFKQDSSRLGRETRETPATTMAQPERDAHGYGKTAGAAGVGAAAVGAYEYGRDKELRQDAIDTPAYGTANTAAPAAVPPEFKQDSSHLGRDTRETPVTTTTEPERDSHGYGKAAAAAGVGAGVGAAGLYGLQHDDRETERSDWPLRDDPTTAPAANAGLTSQGAMEKHPALQTRQQDYTAYNAPPAKKTNQTISERSAAPQYSDRQSRYEEPSQKDTARQEAARAGTAGTGTVASTAPDRSEEQAKADDDAQRRRRREKEAALAGAAGVGAGATGLHEYGKQQHEEDEARRQKDLAEQEEARRRQFEKDQKAATKEAKKEEKKQAKEEKAAAKEEKKHQKEVEKEEKKHQKELEKEDKEHRKELEKEEMAHDKAAIAEQEKQQQRAREERERHEKEAAAAAAVGGGAAAYEVHDKDKHPPPTTATDDSGHTKLHKDPPAEKKPGLLKRIFRRRKNKETGEEEEYEDDEDHEHEPESEHGDHHIAATGVGAGTGATVAGTAVATSHELPANSYEAQSGGAQKPSYNPFKKDDPASAAGVPGTTASAHPPASRDFDPPPQY